MTVLFIKVCSSEVPESFNIFFPTKLNVIKTMIWYAAWPKIFRHITLLINGSILPTGFLSIRSSVGSSVASARAPNVSMIRLIHKSCSNKTKRQSKKVTAPLTTREKCTEEQGIRSIQFVSCDHQNNECQGSKISRSMKKLVYYNNPKKREGGANSIWPVIKQSQLLSCTKLLV
jgi:hypothetical protein